jgi:hypothetical protein
MSTENRILSSSSSSSSRSSSSSQHYGSSSSSSSNTSIVVDDENISQHDDVTTIDEVEILKEEDGSSRQSPVASVEIIKEEEEKEEDDDDDGDDDGSRMRRRRAEAVKTIRTRLNGKWLGWSRSNAEKGPGNSTEWKDTVLRFNLKDDGKLCGRIEGSGVSVWRNMEVSFDVRGWIDFENCEVVLYKQHKGQYTNEIAYRCTIDFKTCKIEGKYKSGIVTLNRTFCTDKEENSALNGVWEGMSVSMTKKIPTTWSDTHLRFEKNSNKSDKGSIHGHGVSLWRGLSIEFDIEGSFRSSDQTVKLVKRHKGQFTNSITYRGVWKRKAIDNRFVITGEYDGGKFQLEQQQQKKKKQDKARKITPKFVLISHEQRKKLESTLNGLWFGESVDKKHHVTKWSDTALYFKFSDDQKSNAGQVLGEGLSLWRDQRIDFDVVGSFDWTNRTVRLTKQHKGMFKNRIMYQGTLLVKDGVPTITGSYDRGRVVLTRRRGLKKERNVTEILSSINNDRSMTSSVTLPSFAIMKKYTLFLSGVLIGGTVDANAQEALRRFRADHKVTQEQHDMTLKSLGVTKAEFNLMKTKDTSDAATSESDVDMCKICFAERIDAVILPCGHFAICRTCGAKLDECPICRQDIERVQVVYRS